MFFSSKKTWLLYISTLLFVLLIPQLFMAQPEYDLQVPDGVMAPPWTDIARENIHLLWYFVPLAVSMICLLHNLMVEKRSVFLVLLIGLSLLSYLTHIAYHVLFLHSFTLIIALSSQLFMRIPLEKRERQLLAVFHFITVSTVLMLQSNMGIWMAHGGRMDPMTIFLLPMPAAAWILAFFKKAPISANGKKPHLGWLCSAGYSLVLSICKTGGIIIWPSLP